MIKKIFFSIVFVLVSVLTHDLLAASGMGMGPPSDPCGIGNFPPCPEAVPIDGGIFLLAGAGLALGAKKMMKKKSI